MYMNSPKLLLFIIFLFNACAPHIKVVERYPNDQKKTTEVFKHKRLGSALKKRLTYHASGQVETETNFTPSGAQLRALLALSGEPVSTEFGT